MSNFKEFSDELPKVGEKILLKNENGEVEIGKIMFIWVGNRSDYPQGISPKELKDLKSSWCYIPE